MAIAGFFSLGYAYGELYNPERLELLKNNVIPNQGLYHGMLIGILIVIILDLIVSYTLYKYFEEDNKKISLASGLIRIAYTVVFAVATYYLTINLDTNGLTNEIVNANFHRFQTIWNCGLVAFGVHLVLIGILMKLHKRIPKILWYTTIIAGVSYMIVHLLKVARSDTELADNLQMILALPMTLGELGLAFWLLIRGGKGS